VATPAHWICKHGRDTRHPYSVSDCVLCFICEYLVQVSDATDADAPQTLLFKQELTASIVFSTMSGEYFDSLSKRRGLTASQHFLYCNRRLASYHA
jgi:hypothetical protein